MLLHISLLHVLRLRESFPVKNHQGGSEQTSASIIMINGTPDLRISLSSVEILLNEKWIFRRSRIINAHDIAMTVQVTCTDKKRSIVITPKREGNIKKASAK